MTVHTAKKERTVMPRQSAKEDDLVTKEPWYITKPEKPAERSDKKKLKSHVPKAES